MAEHRHQSLDVLHGRGVASNLANRFETIAFESDLEHQEGDDDYLDRPARPATQYLLDTSRTILATNDSPDVGFNVWPPTSTAKGQSLLRREIILWLIRQMRRRVGRGSGQTWAILGSYARAMRCSAWLRMKGFND